MNAYDTAIHAISCRNTDKLKGMINEYKIDADVFKTLLQHAMNENSKDCAEILIKHMKDFKLNWLTANVDGSFHQMAMDNGWPDLLQLMINRGATFKKYGSLDVNPMHYAAKFKTPIFVKILGKTIPVDSYCDEEYTPLMIAAEQGNDKTMDELLKLGANPEAQQKPRLEIDWLIPSFFRAFFVATTMATIDQVIHKAASSKNIKTVDVLLKHKPDLNLDKFGTDLKTPLMIAAEKGDKEMVHHLLKLGVNVNKTVTNMNALHFAVKRQSLEIVKLLLEYGINQAHGANHQTALDKLLHESRKYGIQNPELIDLLKYAQNNPQKVISRKPVFFPGREPNNTRNSR